MPMGFLLFCFMPGLSVFLALLDYASRAHEIEICPSSVCVAIISEPIEQIPFKFQLWLPLGLNQGGNGHF